MTRPCQLIFATALPLSFAFAAPALAADEDQPAHESDRAAQPDDIVVAGHPPIDFGLLQSSTKLEGDALVAEARGQLGETLAKLPGVSATSFAPGVSRPVLRGFDGDRIRVLVDGIGSIDASSVSADHAVVFDTLTTDHIDVLHGPATLLFGGQAIGGAVNALDKRIPRKLPDGLTATGIAGFGSAASEWSAAGATDVALGERFVAHVDANWRKSDDVRVGGLVNSAPLRAELIADGLTDEANLTGRIPNSAARSTTFGAGLAFIDAGGNLGVSVQRYDALYGIPARPGLDAEEGVAIDLGQTRIDLRGEVTLGGLFDSLQIRGAFGDYRHVEFEGDEVGTTFTGKGVEGRADLIQAERGGWRGRSGVQVLSRKLDVVGEEAVFPGYVVDTFGAFTLQSLKLGGGFETEAAGRYERTTVKAATIGFNRAFDLWSGAAGISFEPAEGLKLGANYVRGARAPAPEEMLSDGVHIATQSYEVGDPSFATETSDGFEAWVRYRRDRAEISLTGYLTDFDRFITARPTGAEVDGFPVFQYAQLPARFKGVEASAAYDIAKWDSGKLTLDAAADYVHAELKGVGPVPRIPPLRLRGGAEAELGNLHLRGEVEWNAAQNRVAAFESPVPAFTLVNLSADWHPLGEDGALTLILAANNLFDVVGRRAASFTRDFVPLPGRDIRVTAKVTF
ncbi:MAG: TonB-dependent receptor [Novosphingobium sp.]